MNNGNLLFFDNGNLSSQLFNEIYPISRILEVNVIDNSSCEVIFEYSLPTTLFSTAMGSVQSLDNNNYLINSIANNGIIFEINQNENFIWESNLNLEIPALNYRSFRIPGIHPDAFSVIADDLTRSINVFDNEPFIDLSSNLINFTIQNKTDCKDQFKFHSL